MEPRPGAQARGPATAEVVMSSLHGGLQWGVDRMLSVGYGLLYDYIFEKFGPYQKLQAEVLALVEASAKQAPDRRAVQVLDVDCGPGNLTFVIAEAGFSVVGLEPYGALVELAREKRRAKRLANLSFTQGELASTKAFRDASFDQVVNVHSLYAHADPQALLAQAHRILRPGGHAIFVNHTRRADVTATFRELRAREGLGPAMRCLLLWLLPHALFEASRRRIGPHYWTEEQFGANLRAAGFTVLEFRRTFLNDASVLVWARKDRAE
ncbi:MAG: class I SAM-dependent methyltransferase [Candidatus Rokuibacteriota bacterium]|nr:MAG: class I SAM-dependent methyltransferase [Candidatus Rokubacteria bacterium]